MNISSVLVRARPERFGEVLTALAGIAGVAVHQRDTNTGSVVVTVEDGDGYSVEDSLMRVHLIDGISDASLIYQYSDGILVQEEQA